VRARRARGHGLCGCAVAGTLVLDRLAERGHCWRTRRRRGLRRGIGDNGGIPAAVRRHRSCATDGPGHDRHRATAIPVERSPDSSASYQGPLGCAAEQPTRDRAVDSPAECAAAAEAEQHPSVEQSFRAQ
jgi:hypothetical protein